MRFLTVSALALMAGPAWADNTALIFGVDRYDSLDRFRRGTEVVDAADALAEVGFDVIALADGTAADLDTAMRRFIDQVPEADRLVVTLSGLFATDGTRTWYLPRDTAETLRIDTIGRGAVSLETVLLLLGEVPGGAILILTTDDDAEGAFDPWLRLGIGAFDIPQGVTVVRSGPRIVARFLTDSVAEPGTDVAAQIIENGNLLGSGYLPDSMIITSGVGESVQTIVAELPQITLPSATDVERASERALWEGAVALNTGDAYTNYLQRYPSGTFAAEALARRQAIVDEPNRVDRLAEEAMHLSQDDRREIQRALTLLQFNTRGIDGIFGPGTRGALTNWQQQNGFAQTGYVTAEQIVRLDAQAARRAAEIESEAERQRQIAILADRAFWEETGAAGDEPGLRAYLERHPDGLYADAARTGLASIEAERGRLAEAEERTLWQRALAADTVDGYRIYLQSYPNGGFVGAAQARIDELSQEQDTAPAREAARAAEAALGLNQLTQQLIEARLESLGLEPGAADGTFDRDTRRALRRFQRDRGLELNGGFLDEQSVVLLLTDALQ